MDRTMWQSSPARLSCRLFQVPHPTPPCYDDVVSLEVKMIRGVCSRVDKDDAFLGTAHGEESVGNDGTVEVRGRVRWDAM